MPDDEYYIGISREVPVPEDWYEKKEREEQDDDDVDSGDSNNSPETDEGESYEYESPICDCLHDWDQMSGSERLQELENVARDVLWDYGVPNDSEIIAQDRIIGEDGTSYSGYYDPDTNQILLKTDLIATGTAEQVLSLLLHEIGHKIDVFYYGKENIPTSDGVFATDEGKTIHKDIEDWSKWYLRAEASRCFHSSAYNFGDIGASNRDGGDGGDEDEESASGKESPPDKGWQGSSNAEGGND